jgi:nucleoredoxin
MEDIVGSTIVKGGESLSSNTLAGKFVGLYFSAHWCPPCRRFTPQLAETYQKVTSKNDGQFEIVFVSSDKDAGQFDEYFAEMPWAAIPYSDRDRQAALSKKFKVQGIPTLVILNPDGEVVTLDGREALGNDPEGDKFPWIPPTLDEMLGDQFIAVDGSTFTRADLDGKYIGLYFSAHWCGPCRGFTPQLSETYNKLKGEGKNFEIIFVSSDRDEESFNEYRSEMPWLALPFANRDGKAALSSKFGVQGIPTLVILDPDMNTVTTKGRGAVGADKEGAEFPWVPKPLQDISSDADGLNEYPCLIILADDCDGDSAELHAAATDYAAEVAAARKAGTTEMLVCYADTSEGPVGQIRKLTKQESSKAHPCDLVKTSPNQLGGPYSGGFGCDVCEGGGSGDDEVWHCEKHGYDECASCYAKNAEKRANPCAGKVVMLLLDIPDSGGFYVFDGDEVNGDTIREFVAAYEAKTLDRRQLG